MDRAHDVLTTVSHMFEGWTGSALIREELKIFFLSIQVLHFMTNGQVRYFDYFLLLLVRFIFGFCFVVTRTLVTEECGLIISSSSQKWGFSAAVRCNAL